MNISGKKIFQSSADGIHVVGEAFDSGIEGSARYTYYERGALVGFTAHRSGKLGMVNFIHGRGLRVFGE